MQHAFHVFSFLLCHALLCFCSRIVLHFLHVCDGLTVLEHVSILFCFVPFFCDNRIYLSMLSKSVVFFRRRNVFGMGRNDLFTCECCCQSFCQSHGVVLPECCSRQFIMLSPKLFMHWMCAHAFECL